MPVPFGALAGRTTSEARKLKRDRSKGSQPQTNVRGWEETVDFPMSENRRASGYHSQHKVKSPAITLGLAACLIGAPIAGMWATTQITGIPWFGQAQAATFEMEIKDGFDDEDENAGTDIELGAMVQADTAGTDNMKDLFNVKRINYEISAGGIIETAENIIVEPENRTLRFVDSTHDGKISFRADEGYELQSATIEDAPVTVDGNILTIPAGAFGTLKVMFMITPTAAPVTEQPAATAPVSESAMEPARETPSYGSRRYVPEEQPTEEVSYQEPAGEPSYAEPVPEPEPEPEPAPAPEPSAPAAIEGTAGMQGEELAMAQEIFNCYNDWRAAQGLNRTVWDGRCCEMAMGSSRGCAERRKLVHRLGIPGDLQLSYSDILQYASWKMTGNEAITRWANSSGHAAQMRCPTAQNAACAVYQENGIYWFAIVYTFDGCNIG